MGLLTTLVVQLSGYGLPQAKIFAKTTVFWLLEFKHIQQL